MSHFNNTNSNSSNTWRNLTDDEKAVAEAWVQFLSTKIAPTLGQLINKAVLDALRQHRGEQTNTDLLTNHTPQKTVHVKPDGMDMRTKSNHHFGNELIGEFDATKWARNFKKLFPHTDEETMVAWFANAIMAGYDKAKKEERTKHKRMGESFDVQASNGNWDANDYMLGMFNGMEVMMSIMEDREPQFRTLPKKVPSEPYQFTEEELKIKGPTLKLTAEPTYEITGERDVWARTYAALINDNTHDYCVAKADIAVKAFRERYK